jgi:drug/metabolite transporter (DMT)-like permease
MAALLALFSAIAYGAGDFLGGLASRRIPAAAVVLRSNVIGLCGLLMFASLVEATEVVGRDVVLGAAGGVAGGVGILLLYRGLAGGTMSVVAPITAVLTAAVPVVFGLASGERPSAIGGLGVVAGLVAIGLISREGKHHARTPPALLLAAVGAGFGFGLFFIALDATGDDAGLWPIVAGRVASITMFSVVALTSAAARIGDDRARTGTTPWLLLGCGVLDSGANALFLLATQRGLLTLVAVLGALYPAATVLLARIVLGERLSAVQLAGALLAVVSVVLVAAG